MLRNLDWSSKLCLSVAGCMFIAAAIFNHLS